MRHAQARPHRLLLLAATAFGTGRMLNENAKKSQKPRLKAYDEALGHLTRLASLVEKKREQKGGRNVFGDRLRSSVRDCSLFASHVALKAKVGAANTSKLDERVDKYEALVAQLKDDLTKERKASDDKKLTKDRVELRAFYSGALGFWLGKNAELKGEETKAIEFYKAAREELTSMAPSLRRASELENGVDSVPIQHESYSYSFWEAQAVAVIEDCDSSIAATAAQRVKTEATRLEVDIRIAAAVSSITEEEFDAMHILLKAVSECTEEERMAKLSEVTTAMAALIESRIRVAVKAYQHETEEAAAIAAEQAAAEQAAAERAVSEEPTVDAEEEGELTPEENKRRAAKRKKEKKKLRDREKKKAEAASADVTGSELEDSEATQKGGKGKKGNKKKGKKKKGGMELAPVIAGPALESKLVDARGVADKRARLLLMVVRGRSSKFDNLHALFTPLARTRPANLMFHPTRVLRGCA